MRILVVEDEPSVAQALEYLLAGAGHTVALAEDGVIALARFTTFAPDVVLLDLMLPRMNGLEVARRLRRDSDVAIIILTARSMAAEKVVGLEAGADDYLTKPFSTMELLARINAVTRGRVPGPTSGRIVAGPIPPQQRPRSGPTPPGAPPHSAQVTRSSAAKPPASAG